MENGNKLCCCCSGRERELFFNDLYGVWTVSDLDRTSSVRKNHTTCFRIGGDRKTLSDAISYEVIFGEGTNPKYATAHDHATAPSHDNTRGGTPSRDSSNKPSAGRIPTKPAANGIYATLLANSSVRMIHWYAYCAGRHRCSLQHDILLRGYGRRKQLGNKKTY